MDNAMQIRPWEEGRVEEAYEGITRRVLAHTDSLMLVHYSVEEGAVFPVHDHEETHQAVFVLEGAIELLGERDGRLEEGDSFVVGPGVAHGIRGVAENTAVIDAFAPPIEAYADQ